MTAEPHVRGLLTRNDTPFPFVMVATARRPPQAEMSLAVRGRFTLAPGRDPEVADEQGAVSGQVLAGDDLLRCAIDYHGDLVGFKPQAEVLVHATCHPPRRTTECLAGVMVGRWSKSLRVVGERVWTRGVGEPHGEPAPFTSMPLRWENAFGGPEHPANPVGRGLDSELLPNVEYPDQPLKRRGDVTTPAGFGAINERWPVRANRLGTKYGESYRQDRSPFFAEDFDWSYFQAAPPDQRLTEPLRGDERLRFMNLHPEDADFSVRLPSVRVRAFVKDVRGAFREVPMVLDTLFANVEEGLLDLTWRGLTEVAEDDFRDLRWALIVSEPLAGPSGSLESYRARLEAFEADPTGLKSNPQLQKLAALQAGGAPQGPAPATPSAWLDQTFGGLGEDTKPGIGKTLDQVAPGTPPGSGVAHMQEQLARAPDAPEHLRASLGEAKGRVPDVSTAFRDSVSTRAVSPLNPAAATVLSLRRVMRQVREQATALRSSGASVHVPDDVRGPLSEEGTQVVDRFSAAQRADKIRAAADWFDAIPHDPAWKELAPDYEPPGELSTDEPGPFANLAERDFRDVDWSGKNLQGADLRGAVLMGANLSGANLRGAKLGQATLYKANLAGADLSEADLTQAHLGKANADNANLTDAIVTQALFEETSLRGTVLHGMRGGFTSFERADLTEAKAGRAQLDAANFTGACLDASSWKRSDLRRSNFAECAGAGVDLQHCDLRGCGFEAARLTGAKLGEVRAELTFWGYALLDQADFTRALLRGSYLTESSAKGAVFDGADLKDATFLRVDLTGASFDKSNLFRADLSKTNLTKTSFRNACLLEAKLLKIIERGTDYRGANLNRSLVQRV